MKKIKNIDEIEKNNYTVSEVLNIANLTLKRLNKSGNLEITPELFEKYMITLIQLHTTEEIQNFQKINYYEISEKYVLIKDIKISHKDLMAYTEVTLDWIKYLNRFTVESYIYCLIEVIFWYKPSEINFIAEEIKNEKIGRKM